MKSLTFAVIFSTAFACGTKSDDEETAAATATAENPAEDVAAIYSAITTQTGALHITTYGLRLADTAWTSSNWASDQQFPGNQSTLTAKAYVDYQLDPEQKGAMGEVVKKLGVFCVLSQLFDATEIEDGLPTVAAKHAITITDAMASKLETECEMEAADVEGLKEESLSITVEDVDGDVFDRYIVLTSGSGDEAEENPFYIKNSDGIISVSMYEASTDEGNGKHGIQRTQLKIDADGVFQFEKVAFGESGGENGFETLVRGYHSTSTKEIAFLHVHSSSYGTYFVGISGNDKEDQAGAYLAISGSTPLAGAFACFNKSTGDFVNTTGCTENANDSRKRTWNADAALYKAVVAQGKTVWELNATSDIVNFDSTSMFTLEPAHN